MGYNLLLITNNYKNMSEETWQGYGDQECKTCTLIEHSGMLKLCKAMVMYTALQTQAADEKRWGMAIKYEGLQNDLQEAIGCWPGFRRV